MSVGVATAFNKRKQKALVGGAFDLQVKGGVQWIPIPKVRIGFSLATPTYTFLVFERLTAHTHSNSLTTSNHLA